MYFLSVNVIELVIYLPDLYTLIAMVAFYIYCYQHYYNIEFKVKPKKLSNTFSLLTKQVIIILKLWGKVLYSCQY